MAYIGNSPANTGNYQIVDDIASGFNGSATSFALASGGIAITPAKSGQLLASINGVLQEPDDSGSNGFKVSSSNIVFSSAPASGDVFWSVYQGQNVDIGTPSNDVVDTAHIKDNAITADKIAAGAVVADIATGGISTAKIADDAVTVDKLANSINTAIAANTAKTGISSAQTSAITANTAKTGITSSQANAITANTAKTGISSAQTSAITANTAKTGITSSQATAITAALPKAGGTMTGNIAHAGDFAIDVGGDIILDADGSQVRFKDAGTEFLQIQKSGSDAIIYSGGDIKIDADGGDFYFNDGGAELLSISNDSTNVHIASRVNDKDLVFKGQDGGSSVTALTLDMSDGGYGIFNNGLAAGGNISMQGHNVNFNDNGKARFGDNSDLQIYHDASNSYISDTGTGNLLIKGSVVALQGTGGSAMLTAQNGTDVKLYHDGNQKFATTSTGITVTGVVAATTLTGNGSGLTGIATTFASLTDTTVATANPLITTNPSAVGHIFFNKTSGDIFTCTRNTSNENVWINAGDSGTNIRYKKTNGTADLFGDGSDKLHLQFNEPLGSAGTIRDYSANFACTVDQNVDFTKDSMFSNYAAKFNGNGEIQVPFMANTFRRSDNFTISLWITRKGDIADGSLPFCFNGNSSTNGRGVRVTGNNISRVSTTAANTMHGALPSSFTVNDGDHFVVIGHSNATSTLYKNGTSVGTTGTATLGHSNVSGSAGGSIGGIGNVYNPTGVDGHKYFECTINNFRIFNKAVSSTEVATLYAEGY